MERSLSRKTIRRRRNLLKKQQIELLAALRAANEQRLPAGGTHRRNLHVFLFACIASWLHVRGASISACCTILQFEGRVA